MANNKLKLHVVTPYSSFIEVDNCQLVELNTQDGSIGVMLGHVPMVVAILPGLLRYKVDDTFYNAFISVGYATIQKDEVTVITNAAEWPEAIDIERAKASYERGRIKFNAETSTKTAKSHAKHAMRRAKARIHIAENYTRSGVKD